MTKTSSSGVDTGSDAGPEPMLSRRGAFRLGAGGLLGVGLTSAGAVGGASAATTWRTYPFDLFPGAPDFRFPSTEGSKDTHGTDTWFVDGKLVTASGGEFAFIVIFCKNRVATSIRADFYTFALFDLTTGEYGTFTEFDFPLESFLGAAKFAGADDHLDLRFTTSQGPATWSTRRDAKGRLVPFGYRLGLVGKDREQRRMSLTATMDPVNPPTVAGDGKGIITCFGQPDTGTWFQTGPKIVGTLTWGSRTEKVTGTLGHIDRQWFPGSAFSEVGLTARGISHEWRSINLDDGTDLSIWRQFDREDRNRVIPFTGSTRFVPGATGTRGTTEYTPDVEVTNLSYVRWPQNIDPWVPALSPNRYAPAAHRVRIAAWDLDLVATPLVAAPAHALPVEYMIGPVSWNGTVRGRRVSGFGISEKTLIVHRDWELIEVLKTTVDNLPASAFAAGGTTPASFKAMVKTASGQVTKGQRLALVWHIESTMKPAAATLAGPQRAFLTTLLSDLELASST